MNHGLQDIPNIAMREVICATSLMLLAGLTVPVDAASESPPGQSRLGINLSGIVDWNTEHPFVDVFRLSRAWISQKQGGSWGKGPPLQLDKHGWITKLAPECFAETPLLTAGHAPVGDYVCLYDGEGRIEFGANSKTVSRTPGRIVVHIDGRKEGTFLSLRETKPENPVRNIRVIMPGFENTYKTNPFSPGFLNRWRGFNSIRFMDWMDTNGSKQKYWADRPVPEDATWAIKGVPIEVMADLCNRLKANPWFCMPHLASDNYVRQFARVVKEKLDPSLKVYIEYSNEVWNGMFEQHRYAEEQAKKIGLGPKERPWEGAAMFHARRSVEIFAIWEQVYGDRARLVRVIAWQAAGGAYWSDNMLLAQQDTAKHCDALAIAPYISFMPSPDSKSLRSDDVAKWAVEQVLDRVETNALPECVGWMKTQKAVADKYGLKLVCYEAGQHLVGVGGGENNEPLTKLLIDANRQPRMGRIYTKYLDAWRDLGGDLMCIFSSVAASSKWGSWGLLEGADETSSPKFNAVNEWNSSKRAAPAVELRSPSGNLVLTVEAKDIETERSCLFYRLSYNGRAVIADSRVGLNLEPDTLAANLEIMSVNRSQHDTTWKPVCGERRLVRDHYNEVRISLQEKRERPRLLELTCRAYDEGVAFCYTLPRQAHLQSFTVASEATQFAFTADHPVWAVYRAQGNYGDGAVPLSQVKPGAERPLTIQLAEDLFAAITEARCVDYARMKLRLAPGHPHTLEAFLDAERGQAGKVDGTAPFTSPWRVIMVAESVGKLLENNDLILNLNDPCALTETGWIKPGKVIRDTTLTTAGGKACVDFCVQRRLDYVLFDAGWYGPEGQATSDASGVDPKKAGTLNVQEVIRYGEGKGVGVILYVNRRALEKQIDQIFPLYESWGVKGVKFGFVNVGSQEWTVWLHAAVRKAAAHQLMVDIHDEFRDTGYRRTYPNLMTVEGIFGNEEFPTPAHNAALPFTRFLTGPGDYTYCWYSPKLKVTHAHQLALSTIYFSPWQVLYWYDRPSQYQGEPELDYWSYLPTCWDETRVLQGKIGQCASVARRRGSEWFVGTIDAAGGEIAVPLSFLEPGVKHTATVYSDRDVDDPNSKAVKVETFAVDSTTVLKTRTPANGGQAVRIVPAPDR